jgi:hypothetical protein
MAAGIMLLVARFSSSPPFGLVIVQKAVVHNTPFTVVICATPIGGKNLFKALSKPNKAAELRPAAPGP